MHPDHLAGLKVWYGGPEISGEGKVMPLYEFFCPTCECCFEVRRSMREGTADVTCPTCAEANVRRVYTPVIAFSSGQGGVSAIGASGCGSCAQSSCAGCPSVRRN